MRRALRILLKVLVGYVVASVCLGILLAELSLHLYHRPLRHEAPIAARYSRFGAPLEPVEIHANDGTVLRAWYSVPANDNGRAVILLHGVTDNREGVAGLGEGFLTHGYRVLLPDSRAHGLSGGDVATYGVLEADDIHRWVSWLYDRDAACVDGYGASMGAALILESLRAEPRYCAVVADSPFAGFRRIAYDRVGYYVGLGPWFGRSFGLFPTEIALQYAKWRYGLDMARASPLDEVRSATTPILLIHGTADINIPAQHSRILAQANPAHVQLWLVPGARHGETGTADPQDYQRRIRAFLEAHDRGPSRLRGF